MLDKELNSILGPKGWFTSEATNAFSRDWLNRYGEHPLGVAKPASTVEVSRTVSAAHRAGIPIVPQGGNTSLCGGSVSSMAGAVILNLSRMKAMAETDLSGGSILVEAGLVLQTLHEALAGSGLMFPMHLGSEGSAQIGGLIATNAGGSQAFRYGMMQDLVLGLEVVLPDGRIWDGLRGVQKDNAGYQLRKLFCGAEGTLGVATRAILRLHPAPANRLTALLALPSYEAMVSLGSMVRAEAGDFLQAMEFFSDFGLDMTLRNVQGLTWPLQSYACVYLLLELGSGSPLVPLDDIMSGLLEQGMELGLVTDGAVASSEAQRAAFWRLREEQPEGQRLEGRQLKHDISVPPARIAQFIARGSAICASVLSGTRINPFGHLADGNIHYNLTPPSGHDGFDGHETDLTNMLCALATQMGGSFAAEHGLGRAKIGLADSLRSAIEREMHQRIKSAIDPENLMNPGVMFRIADK